MKSLEVKSHPNLSKNPNPQILSPLAKLVGSVRFHSALHIGWLMRVNRYQQIMGWASTSKWSNQRRIVGRLCNLSNVQRTSDFYGNIHRCGLMGSWCWFLVIFLKCHDKKSQRFMNENNLPVQARTKKNRCCNLARKTQVSLTPYVTDTCWRHWPVVSHGYVFSGDSLGNAGQIPYMVHEWMYFELELML